MSLMRPVRYHFGADFSRPVPEPVIEPDVPDVAPAPEPVPMIELAEHERIVAEAAEAARQQGAAEALASSEAVASRMRAEAIEFLAREVGALLRSSDAAVAERVAEAVELARSVGLAIARQALRRFPDDAILAMISENLQPLGQVAQLVVRINPEAAGLGRHIEQMVADHGFDGRLVVRADPRIARPDVRLEWPDGGIVLDHAALIEHLEASIAHHASSLREEAEGQADESPG